MRPHGWHLGGETYQKERRIPFRKQMGCASCVLPLPPAQLSPSSLFGMYALYLSSSLDDAAEWLSEASA